jgi:hypothetical protein
MWHHTFWFQEPLVYLIDPYYQFKLKKRFEDQNIPLEFTTTVNKTADNISSIQLWWRSQLTLYLFRPNQLTRDYIREAKSRIGWPSRDTLGYDPYVVSVHVRHGDKVIETKAGGGGNSMIKSARLYQPWEYFMLVPDIPRVQEHLKRHPNSKVYVYLASDDPAVINETAKPIYAEKGLVFLIDKQETRNNGIDFIPGRGRLDMGTKVDVTTHSLDALKNLWLLGEGDFWVGTFSSCFGKVAYQLMYGWGRTGYVDEKWQPNAISLDQEWYSWYW